MQYEREQNVGVYVLSNTVDKSILFKNERIHHSMI